MTHQILQVVVGLAVMVVSALSGWPLVIAILSRSKASGSRVEDATGTGAEPTGTSGSAEHVGASTATPTVGADADTDTDTDTDSATGPDTGPGTGAGTAGSMVGATSSAEAHGLRGGLWIGLLERFAATGAVLLGEYTILAAIVAVKGLGRFRELSTPAASERFVVGTLASLTWSVLLGVIGRGLLVHLV